MNPLSLWCTFLYASISILYFYRYKSTGESEESLGLSYKSVVTEKEFYLMMTALFHHDSLLYLGLDCFTILLIDISNMNSSTFSALKPVVTLLFFSFLVYLVYFLMLYSIKRTESSSAREERNERFYGLYHYAIISLPLLPIRNSFLNITKIAVLITYFIKEERFSTLLPQSILLAFYSYVFDITTPLYWQFWILVILLIVYSLSYFSNQNGSVLPTTDNREESHHFQEMRNIRL